MLLGLDEGLGGSKEVKTPAWTETTHCFTVNSAETTVFFVLNFQCKKHTQIYYYFF